MSVHYKRPGGLFRRMTAELPLRHNCIHNVQHQECPYYKGWCRAIATTPCSHCKEEGLVCYVSISPIAEGDIFKKCEACRKLDPNCDFAYSRASDNNPTVPQPAVPRPAALQQRDVFTDSIIGNEVTAPLKRARTSKGRPPKQTATTTTNPSPADVLSSLRGHIVFVDKIIAEGKQEAAGLESRLAVVRNKVDHGQRAKAGLLQALEAFSELQVLGALSSP